MAYHIRRQIRTALATALTGLTTTGTRVYPYRVDPLPAGSLPALTVAVVADGVERMEIAQPAFTRRTLIAEVRAVASATSAVENTLDGICAEVETALAVDLTLGGLTIDVQLLRTTLDIDGSGEATVGVATMELQILANVREGSPTAAL